MQTVKCEVCGGQFPMNETFRVGDITACRPCGEKIISEKKSIKSVKRQADPTICVNCGKDHGGLQLPLLAGLPVCPDCETFFKHRPFPNWVKAFLAGVLALVIFALAWNMRFIQAYMEMTDAVRTSHNGNLEKSAELMSSASKRVPESSELRGLAAFYRGLLFLQQDKPAQALTEFDSSRRLLPSQGLSKTLDQLTMSAKISIAFDSNDYDRFLTLSIEYCDKISNDSLAYAQVASAYACKFAVTGDQQFKDKALENLNKARALSQADLSFKEYEQRILHRLYSREIITSSEFHKKFPNGWQEPKKE